MTENRMPDMTDRESRRRLGIVSLLDQFLDTPHPLPRREAMARELRTSTERLEYLILVARSGSPRPALKARLNLTLLMAGSGKRVHK